jgi:fructosamine-3-kinase
MFAAESLALERLRAAGAIRVPAPVTGTDDFLVLEAFEPRAPDSRWHARIGCELAGLHQATARQTPGFERDNYLGTTAQPNATAPDWVSFWRDRRLLWQLEHFATAGNTGDRLLELGYALADRLATIIGEPDEPCVLLHGDLWSGNAAADADGAPVIFDPASYYGRREAELGMMQMFGGFDATCFAAYGEVWPLAPDSARRIAVYRLYHELNHLNLFGRGYYDQCMATLRALL